MILFEKYGQHQPLQTARLNDVDPQGWLADVLARINDYNVQRLDQLLPWNPRKTGAVSTVTTSCRDSSSA
jgi:hypothetical protein